MMNEIQLINVNLNLKMIFISSHILTEKKIEEEKMFVYSIIREK